MCSGTFRNRLQYLSKKSFLLTLSQHYSLPTVTTKLFLLTMFFCLSWSFEARRTLSDAWKMRAMQLSYIYGVKFNFSVFGIDVLRYSGIFKSIHSTMSNILTRLVSWDINCWLLHDILKKSHAALVFTYRSGHIFSFIARCRANVCYHSALFSRVGVRRRSMSIA